MRPHILNLATIGATILVLATLTFPAGRILTSALPPAPATASAALPPPDSSRFIGVYLDPWHVGDWSRAVGARPQLLAKFQSFASRRPVSGFLDAAEREHVRRVMITWEPWRTIPAALGGRAQSRSQFGYRNVDIAAGAQDSYIRGFARSLRGFPGLVYLRYAHEMNGFWYPWSRDSRAYVRAWRRIVRIFRSEGARNVRFVWSVNPSLYLSRGKWRRHLALYWPGGDYVDYVGSTAINFGGVKRYPVARFYPSLAMLRRTYRKPVILTETNTEYRGRVKWLRDLRQVLVHHTWIRGVVWSQLPSRSKLQSGARIGNVNWDVRRDPAAAAVLRRIAQIGSG
jgi:hypothetical protein